MKMKGLIAILSVLMAAFVLSQTAPPSQQVQFEKALALEEAQGKLKEAIALYQKIVDESKDQALAAQAQLRIGICYQKLGHKEAQIAFQKVIDNYPDQAEAVKLAREQLSMLLRAQTLIEKGALEYKISKIHTDPSRVGWLSPDGTKLALTRTSRSTLWIRNIASGREVSLLPSPELIMNCIWSPDSRLIAYATGLGMVKIVSADGGQPKTIIEPDSEMKKTGNYARPTGWSTDSKKLIFQVNGQGLYAIPASGGNWEAIYRFQDPSKEKERGTLVLSPDGNFIAYSAKQGNNSDIYVMPTRGGEPVRITDNPARNGDPQWSHDGQWLAFTSSGTGIWVVRISPDGKPDSSPIQAAKENFFDRKVWTQDGKIAFCTTTLTIYLFTTNTDGGEEIRLTGLNNWNAVPRWSPDGKKIAYNSYYGAQSNRLGVWTVPSNGGDEKFLAVGSCPAWSPDGKAIAFGNEAFLKRATISIIPADGGEARELLNYDGALDYLDWSPDGKNIAFSYCRVKDGKNDIPDSRESEEDIYVISMTGGEPRRVTRIDKKGFYFMYPRWSPDGRKIAFLSANRATLLETGSLSEVEIYTIDVDGGVPKLVTREIPDYWFCWSRDGKDIIFSKTERGETGSRESRLYKVSAEGGKAEGMSIMGEAPDFSPAGNKIAFQRRAGHHGFWLAENFLPANKKDE